MSEMPEFLTDSAFDLDNHDIPFEPLEAAPEVIEMLNVEGWDCSGILHEADCETETYELRDGEWVYTGTDTDRIENHAITWFGDHSVPGLDGSEQAKLGIEYSDSAIHTDENGEPVEMGPGYILFGHGGTLDGEFVGDIKTKTYTNLARALFDAVQLLTFICEGVLPADVTTEQPVKALIEDITDTELP